MAERRPVDARDAEWAADLFARCRAREELAWEELYHSHFDFVYRVASRLGIADTELEDVCQEVFFVAFRKIEGLQDGKFSRWLYRITANIVSDRHRRSRLREALLTLWGKPREEVVESGPYHAYSAREARQVVGRVLARMSPKKREVFALFELDGLTGEEIAERVGCKLDTVWTRLHHARKEFVRIARKRGVLP